MKKRLKLLSVFAACSITVSLTGFSSVLAEEPDFSDTTYWNNKCTGDEALSEEDAADCRAYTEYMQSRNQQLQSQISEIEARREQISANISNYSQQIEGFNAQIAGINSIIADLNAQITAIEEQVADIEGKIQENEKAITIQETRIEELKEKVGNRMVEQQKTMRLMEFLDVMMGAESFDDFIRLANGINSIYERDSYSLQSLNDRIVELNNMEEQLLADQETVKNMEAELEIGRQELNNQQAALLSSRYELDILRQSYNDQLAQADSEKTQAEALIAANDSAIGSVNTTLSLKPTPEPSSSGSSSDSEDDEDDDRSSSSASSSSSSTSSTSNSSFPSSSSSSSSSSSGSFTAPETGGGGNPYYGGWANCTWGTWQLVHDTLGISLPGWGMAGNWLNDAAASGYATGSTPKVYSIAVYSWHVAFVTAVDGDRVYIKEGNYLGHYYERWVPAEGLPYTGQSCLGYIYL